MLLVVACTRRRYTTYRSSPTGCGNTFHKYARERLRLTDTKAGNDVKKKKKGGGDNAHTHRTSIHIVDNQYGRVTLGRTVDFILSHLSPEKPVGINYLCI